MRPEYQCIFCRKRQYGKSVLIEESLPQWVKRTYECPDCGKELEGARQQVKLFGDPVKIAFQPDQLSGEEEDGVRMADLWKDPLARTLWLALATHYLKDQHFRRRRLDEAEGFRKQPPRTVDEFRGRIHTGGWIFDSLDHDIARALFPYIVYELNSENLYRYFILCRLPFRSLGWRYEEPKPSSWSTAHVNGVLASRRPEGSRVILLED